MKIRGPFLLHQQLMGPMNKDSILPGGIEKEWSSRTNSNKEPAAITASSGSFSWKYLSVAMASGQA